MHLNKLNYVQIINAAKKYCQGLIYHSDYQEKISEWNRIRIQYGQNKIKNGRNRNRANVGTVSRENYCRGTIKSRDVGREVSDTAGV